MNMLQGKDLTDEQATSLASMGWLYTRGGKYLLHPMIIRAWAEENSNGDDTRDLPNVLRKMFFNDSEARGGSEVFPEKVFMYFEQARRLSFPSDHKTSLREHYRGGTFHECSDMATEMLTLPNNKIKQIDNFDNVEGCKSALNAGSIIVSRRRTEKGVECIFPFRKDSDTVWCGGVQVKYTGQDGVDDGVGLKIFKNTPINPLDPKPFFGPTFEFWFLGLSNR